MTAKKEKLILLDFDGTLVPIRKTPDAVFLNRNARQVLARLCRAPQIRLVIISGRRLQDLYSLVRLKNAIYVGNHGLEIKGKKLKLPAKIRAARKYKDLIELLSQKFKMALGHCYEGVLVENKGFTLSLHYRNMPKDLWALFNQELGFFKKKYRHYPLLWTKGKKVWEIRPKGYWGKGEAVTYLLKQFPRALPLAIGDDRTDEDMFRAIKKRGLSIRVGYLRNSSADYYLKSTEEVLDFLKKLCLPSP